jgi:hypothetical protein
LISAFFIWRNNFFLQQSKDSRLSLLLRFIVFFLVKYVCDYCHVWTDGFDFT